MRRIISLITAALTLAACSDATAPDSADRSVEAAKAKAALGAVAKSASNGRAVGKLSAN
jgi:hypothetical protein